MKVATKVSTKISLKYRPQVTAIFGLSQNTQSILNSIQIVTEYNFLAKLFIFYQKYSFKDLTKSISFIWSSYTGRNSWWVKSVVKRLTIKALFSTCWCRGWWRQWARWHRASCWWEVFGPEQVSFRKKPEIKNLLSNLR